MTERVDFNGVGVSDRTLDDIYAWLTRSRANHPPFRSPAEAYGIMAMELDEFFDWLKIPRPKRDEKQMRAELIHLAAMALRAADDLYGSESGQA